MAVTGISQSTDSYRLNQPTVTPVPAPTSPVDKADASSIASAINLGDLSSIVSTFGQNFSSGTQTYNAAGLLNSIAKAGHLSSPTPTIPTVGTDTPSYEQDLSDLSVVSTLSSVASTSGIYTPTGFLQKLPTSAANDSTTGKIVNTKA